MESSTGVVKGKNVQPGSASPLLSSEPLFFDPLLAAQIGLDEAILMGRMRYLLVHNAAHAVHQSGGRVWCFGTVRGLAKLYPFWSRRQIERVLTSLTTATETRPAVLLKRGSTDPTDQRSWFTVTDAFQALVPQARLLPSDETVTPPPQNGDPPRLVTLPPRDGSEQQQPAEPVSVARTVTPLRQNGDTPCHQTVTPLSPNGDTLSPNGDTELEVQELELQRIKDLKDPPLYPPPVSSTATPSSDVRAVDQVRDSPTILDPLLARDTLAPDVESYLLTFRAHVLDLYPHDPYARDPAWTTTLPRWRTAFLPVLRKYGLPRLLAAHQAMLTLYDPTARFSWRAQLRSPKSWGEKTTTGYTKLEEVERALVDAVRHAPAHGNGAWVAPTTGPVTLKIKVAIGDQLYTGGEELLDATTWRARRRELNQDGWYKNHTIAGYSLIVAGIEHALTEVWHAAPDRT